MKPYSLNASRVHWFPKWLDSKHENNNFVNNTKWIEETVGTFTHQILCTSYEKNNDQSQMDNVWSRIEEQEARSWPIISLTSKSGKTMPDEDSHHSRYALTGFQRHILFPQFQNRIAVIYHLVTFRVWRWVLLSTTVKVTHWHTCACIDSRCVGPLISTTRNGLDNGHGENETLGVFTVAEASVF